jgi:hypothetical protein
MEKTNIRATAKEANTMNLRFILPPRRLFFHRASEPLRVLRPAARRQGRLSRYAPRSAELIALVKTSRQQRRTTSGLAALRDARPEFVLRRFLRF